MGKKDSQGDLHEEWRFILRGFRFLCLYFTILEYNFKLSRKLTNLAYPYSADVLLVWLAGQ
jgi:hypothetical protein